MVSCIKLTNASKKKLTKNGKVLFCGQKIADLLNDQSFKKIFEIVFLNQTVKSYMDALLYYRVGCGNIINWVKNNYNPALVSTMWAIKDKCSDLIFSEKINAAGCKKIMESGAYFEGQKLSEIYDSIFLELLDLKQNSNIVQFLFFCLFGLYFVISWVRLIYCVFCFF